MATLMMGFMRNEDVTLLVTGWLGIVAVQHNLAHRSNDLIERVK